MLNLPYISFTCVLFSFQMSAVLSSQSVSHEQMVAVMKKSWFEWNYLIDPHTATGMHVAYNENRYDLNLW